MGHDAHDATRGYGWHGSTLGNVPTRRDGRHGANAYGNVSSDAASAMSPAQAEMMLGRTNHGHGW